MEDRKSGPEACIVRIKNGKDWAAVFAIDAREYDGPEEFRAIKLEVFDEINRRPIIAEFETRYVGPDERIRLGLPSWEQYRKTLPAL